MRAHSATIPFKDRLARRLQHGDIIFWVISMLFAVIVVALLFAIIAVTWDGSGAARHAFGFRFLTTSVWNPVSDQYGAAPAIYGTVVSSLLALLFAAPLGIMIAVFLNNLCPVRLRMPIGMMVELLAAIPSVVYGMWGIFVFIPFFRDHVSSPVSTAGRESHSHLRRTGEVGRGLFVAGIILAIMILADDCGDLT